jgi:bacillolysin
MVYGSGYASALDVVGHEMTHGVTEKKSNLFSYYQSGAINESVSDVMGEMIQQIEGPAQNPSAYAGTPWLLGEDLFPGGLRNMSNPTLDNPPDPDRMTSSNYNAYHPWDSSFDSGGVHANDGVNNKAAYLMAAGADGSGGGSFNTYSIAGVSGADQIEKDVKLANIYYRLDKIMSSGTSYADLYNLLPQACNQLVGVSLPAIIHDSTGTPVNLTASGSTSITSADCAQVTRAVKATEMNKQPVYSAAKIVPASPTCTNGGAASKKRLDNFETSNPLASTGTYTRGHGGTDSLGGKSFGQWWWSKSNISDYGTASVPVFQDQHSKYSLWGDDADPFGASQQTGQPYDRQDSWVQTKSAIPAKVGTFVRFDDAWEFDYGPSGNPGDSNIYNFDGGRVEYSVDGGKHWYDTGAPSAVDKFALLVNGGYNGRINNTDGLFTDPKDPTFHYIDPNPLKGKKGFVGSSHGWTSSRLDLSSLNKKSVLLRWRVAADDSIGSLGWYVDNVYAYSCNPTHVSISAPAKVVRGTAAVVRGHLTRTGTTTVLAGLPVVLWERRHGTTTWAKVGTRTTNKYGNVRWSRTHRTAEDYRVRMPGRLPFAPSNYARATVRIA